MIQSVSRFWENYINISKAYGVKPSALHWYVRYAEEYFKAQKGVRLSMHTPAALEEYLREKGRIKNLKDWQYKKTETRGQNTIVSNIREYCVPTPGFEFFVR